MSGFATGKALLESSNYCPSAKGNLLFDRVESALKYLNTFVNQREEIEKGLAKE
jgi:hypothetical protein